MAICSTRAVAADASPTCRANTITIQAASTAPRIPATRRRVRPAIAEAREVRQVGDEIPAAGPRPDVRRRAARRPSRRARPSGGVAGGRRTIRARVADAAAAVSTRAVVTGELSRPRVTVLLDSSGFEHPCYSRSPHAHLRPRRSRGRPRRPARGAVDRPRGRPPRRHPGRGRPNFADFPAWLDPRIVAGLGDARDRAGRIRHQAEAMDAVHAGEDVVIVTPTASGKTLCYALPDAPGHRRGPGVARAVPVPDQGARPGPGGRVRRARGGGRAVDHRRRPTTATRRRPSAPRSGPPARWS